MTSLLSIRPYFLKFLPPIASEARHRAISIWASEEHLNPSYSSSLPSTLIGKYYFIHVLLMDLLSVYLSLCPNPALRTRTVAICSDITS